MLRPFCQHLRKMSSQSVEPLVEVLDGLIRGKVAKSILGETYYSFQGIPYAEPPVGPLRFKPPQRIQPWTGELSALEVGPYAPSMMMGTSIFLENSSEDCLYLNVYTKELPSIDNPLQKPVMVWIHGGAFTTGSGGPDFYSPDYLLAKDVVLVTLNYRLGALGFLSLQNEECPGNNALRDMLEALSWVNRNIAGFGGDENNVTLFGESAGGASVQLLMLSERSCGLFHRAISQSGSALNPWAINQRPVECAFALGESLGFEGTDEEELLDFLREASAKDIVIATQDIMDSAGPDKSYLKIPFTPVVEPFSDYAVLDVHPEKLLRQGQIIDIPYIIGLVDFEGPTVIPAGKSYEDIEAKEEWEILLPPSLQPGTEFADSILDQIKSFYFPDGFNERNFYKALSWAFFLEGIYRSNQLLDQSSRKSRTFFYHFSHDGGVSLMKSGMGLFHLKGTFHGDELHYLFHQDILPYKHAEGSANFEVCDKITKMWTDFARTGNPTPDDELWTEYSEDDKNYLEIGEQVVLKKDLFDEEAKFWTEIWESISECS